ncbi:MAG: pirin family protein [Saprospiraceae bacterium]|nr:pirin family protein [Saprospiraceae bacterium]
MSANLVIQKDSLGFPWDTIDPFLFCVHHEDFYPKGNANLGPEISLAGRNLGNDFTVKDGFRMYHGTSVPGFPAHPHRGFETVTIARKGFVDHSDSLGAAGRFGEGDVQWMTAGKGVQHAEMFPLLNRERDNPFEIFQIWLNLPKAKKMAEPHFAMLWADTIPSFEHRDTEGRRTLVNIVAGQIENTTAPDPAPDSWAADPENEVAIWTITMEPGASWTLPLASSATHRRLYFYKGNSLKVANDVLQVYEYAQVRPDAEVNLTNGDEPGHLLMLQGKPINEQVVQYGPFVMNSEQEIQETYQEFRRTQFGGWPWPSNAHVHPRERGRFAKYADGTLVEK